MNAVLTLALKDLRLLTRDWFALFWIFAFPLLFALFFGAVTGGGGGGRGQMPVAVVDEDQTAGSRGFIDKLAKKLAVLKVQRLGRAEAQDGVRKGELAAFVLLKPGFGRSSAFYSGTSPVIEMGIDPRRQAEAGILQGLLMETTFADVQDRFTDPKASRKELHKAMKGIDRAKDLPPEQRRALKQFFTSLDRDMAGLNRVIGKLDRKNQGGPPGAARIKQVEVFREGSYPLSAFEITFPSAILWALMGCVTAFAISIVTERVAGTMLRLRLAPLSRAQILAGKGLACFLASTGVAVFLLLVGHFLFQVRLENPLGLLLAVVCTAGCFVGLMMLFATLGRTEQGVAGAGWGILMPLAMLGGGMIPLFFMPPWMQTASNVSPVKWGILALEGAIWRDFSLAEMLLPCAILLGVGAICFGLGTRNLARAES
jgi:ABC-2 type transport system permease protein